MNFVEDFIFEIIWIVKKCLNNSILLFGMGKGNYILVEINALTFFISHEFYRYVTGT